MIQVSHASHQNNSKQVSPLTASRARTYVAMLLRVAYVAVIMWLSVHARNLLRDGVNPLQSLVKNWQQHPVTDIRTTTALACPLGYDESMVNWHFPGFQAGCDCRGAAVKIQQVVAGECTLEQQSSGCEKVTALPSIDMTYWGQTSFPIKLCIKREELLTFRQLRPQEVTGKCADNTRNCGSDNQFICIPEASSCPITRLSIKPGFCSLSDTSCHQVFSKGSKFKKLVLQTRDEGLPAVQFTVNEYEICSEEGKQNIAPGRTDFVLRNRQRNQCDNGADNGWNLGVIDSLSESNFYRRNGLLHRIQNVPGIDAYLDPSVDGPRKNPKYKLYARTYARWSKHCERDFESVYRIGLTGFDPIAKIQAVSLVANSVMCLLLLASLSIDILYTELQGKSMR